MAVVVNNSLVLYLLKLLSSISIYLMYLLIYPDTMSKSLSIYFFILGQIITSGIWVSVFYPFYSLLIKIVNAKMVALVISFFILGIIEILLSQTREINNIPSTGSLEFIKELIYPISGIIISCITFIIFYRKIGRKMIKSPTYLP